jgi:hypothetical protein
MKYTIGGFIFFLSLACSSVTLAQTPTVVNDGNTPTVHNDPVTIENPLQAKNITELFAAIIDVILVFAIPIIVFFIIYAGFLYVTARGNENTIQKAHMALLYALIGGLIILGARVLIDVVKGTVEQVTGEETSEI